VSLLTLLALEIAQSRERLEISSPSGGLLAGDDVIERGDVDDDIMVTRS